MADYSVYHAAVNSSVLSFARDVCVNYYGDYLFFRGGEYDYYLICGTLDFTTFSFSDSTVYHWSYQYDHDINTYYYRVSSSDGQSGRVYNSASVVVYGSGADLPKLLDNRGDIYAISTAFGLCVFFGSWVISHLFSSVHRHN